MRDAAKLIYLAGSVIGTNHEFAGRAAELWTRDQAAGLAAFAAIWLAALLLVALFAALDVVRYAHNTPAITRGLMRHPRFHVHFTPTRASWICQRISETGH